MSLHPCSKHATPHQRIAAFPELVDALERILHAIRPEAQERNFFGRRAALEHAVKALELAGCPWNPKAYAHRRSRPKPM